MRALLVGPGFTLPGGIQYVGHLMAEALHRIHPSDLELDIVSLLDDGNCPLRIPVAEWSASKGTRRAFLRLLRHAIRRAPDVIVVNHVNLLPYLAVAATGLRTPPVAVIMHGIEAWRPMNAARRFGLRRVTCMIYVSDFTRRRSVEVNPVLKRVPARVCHHGLLTETARSANETGQTTPARSAPFVLMIGRMASGEQYKGYEEMIRAWPEIRRHRPELELVLVGGGDDKPRLESIARDISGVSFAGQVSDADRDYYMSACEAFALPSRGEGFGLVYLEAMKAGKPVIAGSLDAGAEVIVDGATGRAIDPRVEQNVVSAVLEVTSESGSQMGRAGQQRFLEEFTFESYANRFCAIVQELLTAPARLRESVIR